MLVFPLFPFRQSKIIPWNPLDGLLIHPESYDLARRVAEAENMDLDAVGSPRFTSHFASLQGKASAVAAGINAERKVDDVALILEAFSQVNERGR